MKKLLWISISLLIIAVGIYLFNYFTLIKPVFKEIKSDSRNKGVTIDLHYKYFVQTNILVYNLKSIDGEISIADVFRVLLETTKVLKKNKFKTVELCFKGNPKFILKGEYFLTLGQEYDGQNPIYTMRTFPQNLYRIDGTAAYSEWSGGIFGVLEKQMEDFKDFQEKWYLNDMNGK